jgi:hypothetical protein
MRPSAVENQVAMAQEGAIDMLVALLACESHKVQRQAAKALANLGVNGAWQLWAAYEQHWRHCSLFNFDLLAIACTCTMPTAATNKPLIARAGGVPPLITLAASTDVGVSVEAVAALANLAVNGTLPPVPRAQLLLL